MTPSNWINYLAPASGPPPSTVMAFFRWALAGSMPALWLSGRCLCSGRCGRGFCGLDAGCFGGCSACDIAAKPHEQPGLAFGGGGGVFPVGPTGYFWRVFVCPIGCGDTECV